MTKFLKLTLLALSVFFSLTATYLYWVKPPVHLVELELGGCRIFTSDYFQRTKCYENALSMYLNNSEFRDTALVAFQDICNQGESNACFAKDQLRKESSLNYSPFQEHIDNGNLDALRCINKRNDPQDAYIKDYYCSKAHTYGQLIKDTYLISEIEQNWRPFDGPNALSQIEHNFVFDDAYNEDLFKKNCSSISSQNQRLYCDKFVEVNNLRKKLFSAIYDFKNPDVQKIKSLFKEVCSKFPLGCWIMIQESDLNVEIYKRHKPEEKSAFLKDFGTELNLMQRMLVWAWLNEEGLLPNVTPFTLQDLILKLSFLGNYQEILNQCSLAKSNKEGCFLGLKNLAGARSNPGLLKDFCDNKDPFSCKLIQLIKYNHVLHIDDTKPIKILFHNYRSAVLESYMQYPLRKFFLFLDRNRTSILAITIGLVVLIQIFILMLFKRSEDVFRFIRQQTISKLQAKLNGRSDN